MSAINPVADAWISSGIICLIASTIALLIGASIGAAEGKRAREIEAVKRRLAIYHPVTREFTWVATGSEAVSIVPVTTVQPESPDRRP